MFSAAVTAIPIYSVPQKLAVCLWMFLLANCGEHAPFWSAAKNTMSKFSGRGRGRELHLRFNFSAVVEVNSTSLCLQPGCDIL